MGDQIDRQLVPGPPKYAEYWPFWLFLVALGYFFTYFWGPGSHRTYMFCFFPASVFNAPVARETIRQL